MHLLLKEKNASMNNNNFKMQVNKKKNCY